jgi:hypothetical protein
MSNANFEALLNTQVDEIEKPKPLPMGTYTFGISGHEFGESAQKKTPFVKFQTTPKVAGEDVDQDMLTEVKDWQSKNMNLTFYLTDDSMFRLKDFLEHCGISTAGRTLGECIPETQGAMFNGYIKHETATNGTDVFAQIGTTAAAE